MTAAEIGLGETLRTLRSLGFRPLRRIGAARGFEGDITCRVGVFRIQIHVFDWDFITYPIIRVVQRPPGLPDVVPHIGAKGGLCYFTNGAVILDRYHPEQAIVQCLNQARDELDRLTSGSSYRQGEFQTEFGASWNIGQEPRPDQILLGTLDSHVKSAKCFRAGTEQYFVIASEPSEVEAFCATRGWEPPEPVQATCWIVRSPNYPTLPSGSLPRTVGEMFQWLKLWDRRVYAAIQDILGSRAYLAEPRLLFLIHSPAGWFGFSIPLEGVSRLAFERRPSGLRQLFHGRRSKDPIVRLSVTEIGRDFVHSRNLLFPSLKDQAITLIGCGAIGGYLAQSLVKLGAGTGSKGKLVLIDPEALDANNLARHLLGFESLFKSKAEALRDELLRQFPQTLVSAIQRHSLLPGDLQGDLVIDATGEEAFSEALNFHRQCLPVADRPPVLHVWVGGNGEFTQGLWVDHPRHACFRCLRLNDGTRRKRFEVLPSQTAMRIVGCQAFTPYAVSAPMSAAALASDMVISWVKGEPSPRFRTRLIEGVSAHGIKNQNISPLSGCPACGRS